jgi:hypothetical protein
MSIQWGIPLLRYCLPDSLFDHLQSAANDPSFAPPDPGVLPTWNGKTGELLKEVALLRMCRVSRRKFRNLCAEGISVEVRNVSHRRSVPKQCSEAYVTPMPHSTARSLKTSYMTMIESVSPPCLWMAREPLGRYLWAQTGFTPNLHFWTGKGTCIHCAICSGQLKRQV